MRDQDNMDFERQIRDIYASFEKHEASVGVPLLEKPSFKHLESKHILSRYVVAPALVFLGYSILVFLMGWALAFIKLAFLFLLLVWYVALPALQIMEIYEERGEYLKFFKNPNNLVIDGLTQTITDDYILAESLKKHTVEALQLVKTRISVQQATIDIRLGTLVGALTKVGIVPGLATLFLAALSKQNEVVTLSLAVVVFVLYLFAFTVHFSLPRLSLYVQLIEAEIERKRAAGAH